VDPMVSGSSAAYDTLQVVWLEMRHLVEVLVWALIAGLAGAAGCWCCGYAVRAAWLKAGPPARRRTQPRPGQGQADADGAAGGAGDGVIDLTGQEAVQDEAERGIRELEAYLEAVSSERDRGPDAGPGGS